MKKIIGLLFVLSAMPAFVFADESLCRNANILSYTPAYQTNVPDINDIFFYTTPEIKISSLEASINGIDYPVEYRSEGELIRARVRIPDTVRGELVTSIGAQSENVPSTCNKPLWFLFTR